MLTSSELSEQYGAPLRRINLGSSMVVELRPVSTGAPETAVGIMYRRSGDMLRQSGAGMVKGGIWCNAKGKPLDTDGLYWTAILNRGE